MATIVPAILEGTIQDFNERVSLVTKISGIERIQVDFGDGEFISSRLLDVSEMDTLSPAFFWEAHLMCKGVKDFLDYQISGLKTIILHVEAYAGETDLLDAISKIKELKLNPAVAISPETPVEAVNNLAGAVNQFLVMSVVPGKQGQAFLPVVLEKLSVLRFLYPHTLLEVDGGVNEANIKSIKEAGADLICVGSALVKAPDLNSAYEKLNKICYENF